MPAPSIDVVAEYVSDSGSTATPPEIAAALRAETAAQAKVCRVPAAGEEWDADLAEALCRRVVHNLALRRLALGLQATVTDLGVSNARVGGTDAEVRRLEAPYRKLVIG